MRETSLYESEPGVVPVRVVSLRALRARAKRGRFDAEVSMWPDFFEGVAERD